MSSYFYEKSKMYHEKYKAGKLTKKVGSVIKNGDNFKDSKGNGFPILSETDRNNKYCDYDPINFLEIFHTIKTTEFEGVEVDEIIENSSAFAIICKSINDLYFNYVTIKHVKNEKQVIDDFLSIVKNLVQRKRKPLLNIPLINNYDKIVNSLVEKNFFRKIGGENILIFKNESFLSKEFVFDSKIKFEKATNPKRFAKAIYRNFNSNIAKDDLYGRINKQYIKGIINSFKENKAITRINFQAIKNHKIISTITITMDNSNKIAGITNASTYFKHRRKGINSKLLQMAISEIKYLGGKIIFADTEEGNASEKSLSKCGFESSFKIAVLEFILNIF